MITTLVISSLVSGRYALKKKCHGKVVTAVAIFLNIATALGLIFVNKWLYVHMKFPNMFLTLLHFIVTFLCLQFCKTFSVFHVKSIPFRDVFPLALSFCGFVVLTNLSLEYNTVGTFQVAKVLTTPCVLFIQWKLYSKSASKNVRLTIIPIVIGVFLSFYYDIRFSILGTIFAGLGVVVTSMYQVLVGTKQAELQVNSMQLLYFQAPLSAVMLFGFVVILEPIGPLLTHSWKLSELVAVTASCLMAFGVNLSIYWIIGNTSALTYNMVGHFKFCLTLLGGFVLFSDPITLNQFAGIALTLLGVFTYTHIKMKEDEKKQRSKANLVQNC